MSLNLVKHCVISVPPWLWEMKELIGQLLVFVQWPMWPTGSWSGNTLSALNLLHLYKEIPFQARYTSYNWMVSHFVFLVEWLNIPSSKTQHYFQKKKKKKVCGKSGASLGGFSRADLSRIPLIYAECECLYSVSTFHAPLHPLSVCLSNILVNSIMLSATNKTAVLKGVALPI